MKYLFIQTQTEFLRFDPVDYDQLPGAEASYPGRGWYLITHSIKSGEFLKIRAAREGVQIEAQFNMVKNVPDHENGKYQISGGRFAGTGVFLNVSTKENEDFKHFFVCHSNSPQFSSLLRWQVGIDGFIDADNISDEN